MGKKGPTHQRRTDTKSGDGVRGWNKKKRVGDNEGGKPESQLLASRQQHNVKKNR